MLKIDIQQQINKLFKKFHQSPEMLECLKQCLEDNYEEFSDKESVDGILMMSMLNQEYLKKVSEYYEKPQAMMIRDPKFFDLRQRKIILETIIRDLT